MGDVSTEPSMEDILSSIKRIIAEEGDAPARPRRQPRAEAMPIEAAADARPEADPKHDEVLELDEPIDAARAAAPAARIEPAPVQAAAPAQPRPEPVAASRPAPAPTPAHAAGESIVSRQAAAAARGSLDSLSRLIVKPDPGSDGTLEGLVRELLRPMLTEWLDAHLPALVESMVEREIARITAERR